MHACGVSVRPVSTALVAPRTVPRQIGGADEAGLVRPGFGQLAFGQRLVQPGHRVITQPRVQYQVRAARHDVDGVDLQQAHALHGGHHVGAPGASPAGLQQALGRQLQQARLGKAEGGRS